MSNEPNYQQIDDGAEAPESLRIDGIEIEEVLGTGGMSVVFKAHQLLMGRLVAVKVLHKFLLSDAKNLERFRREAKLSTTLDHPNVASVYALGTTEDKRPYLIMEYCQGQTLKDAVEKGQRFSLEEIQTIFGQICAGLEHAHSHGIVHRDLKPANVFLRQNDDGTISVKLIDFGIAKVTDAKETAQNLTTTGMVIGTPDYMSPEQCIGENVDRRSDIYALGCVLYFALTGESPFSGSSSYEIASQHVAQPLPSVAALKIDYAQTVDAIVQKATAKKPDDRFQTAAEFAKALRDVKSAARTLKMPKKPRERRPKLKVPGEQHKPPLKIMLAALVVVLLAGSLGWMAWSKTGVFASRHSAALLKAEEIFNHGNYLLASPQLLVVQQTALSNDDATRLTFDLIDLVRIFHRDRPPIDATGLRPPLERSVNESAEVMARMAAEPSGNQPSQFALACAVLARADISGHKDEILESMQLGGLSEQERNFCEGMHDRILASPLSWEKPTLNQAIRLGESAVAHLRKGGEPAALFWALRELAGYYANSGNLEKANALNAESLQLEPAIAAHSDRDSAFALSYLAYFLLAEQRLEEAQTAIDRAGQIYADKCGGGADMALYFQYRGMLALTKGNIEEALRCYQQAVPFQLKDHRTPENMSDIQIVIADCYQRLGHPDKALEPLKVALDYTDNVRGKPERALKRLQIWTQFAAVYDRLNQPAEAARARHKMLPILERACTTAREQLRAVPSKETADQYHNAANALALIYAQLGDRAKAIEIAKQECADIRQTMGECVPLAWAYATLSNMSASEQERLSAMETATAIAERVAKKKQGQNVAVKMEATLGVAYAERLRFAQAVPLLEKVESAAQEKNFVRADWEIFSPFALANSYYALGKREEALQIYKKFLPTLKPGQFQNQASVKQAWVNYRMLTHS